MSSKRALVNNCIVLDGVPRSLNKSQLTDIIRNNDLKAKILRHCFQDKNNLNKWILQLDSSDGVSHLCDEVQEVTFDTSDNSYTITFQRCDMSDLPENWVMNEEGESMTARDCVKAKLSHLPEHTDEDYLEHYFKDFIGNEVEIESILFDENGSEAVIELKSNGVYDILKEKHTLDMEGQKVIVELSESKGNVQDDPRTIEVTSKKGAITEKNLRTIKMYFSNKGRSDGGKITEMNFSAETETILIRFESAEVAKAVSLRKDHKYKEVLLNVVLLDDDLLRKRAERNNEKPKSVQVTNLPQDIDKETLELFFEDIETFGDNITVIDVQLDAQTSSAIVEFEQSDAVERISKTKDIDLEGHMVHIEIMQNVTVETCTVEVVGPPDCLSQSNIEALRMYFNNKRRSGGEHVVNCCLQKPGLVEVTFEISEVAKRVAELDSHTFKSTLIQVSLKVTKPADSYPDKSNKLLFSGVDTTIKDDLVLHLEDMFENVHITNEIPCKDDLMVILEFEDLDGAQTILLKQPICIEGHFIDVKMYKDEPEKLCTIQVQGLQNIDDHIDSLRMYFKNNKRSGGGPVVSCTVDKERDVAFITFETEEVAQSVVDRPKHEWKGKTMEVRLYNPKEELTKKEVIYKENTRKVLIKDLPKEIDEEFLELFFEDYGDASEMQIEIEKVDMSNDRSSAIVEFHEQTEVDFILKSPTLKMKDKIVSVEQFKEDEKELCTVEVHGITDIGRSLDKVLLYFKSTKRSKGGVILNHSVDIRNNIVYITYETQEVAERVVSHDHSGQGYEVIRGTGQTSDMDCEEQNIDTVKVQGVDKTISTDTLTFYFESKRSSGGGPIVSIRRSEEDEDVVYITFESSDDAKNVTSKHHTVQKCSMRASLYKPLPCYENKVLIKGLKSTRDALFLFLEATVNVEPIKMEHHEDDEDTVMVTLKENIDFERLEKVCKERQLEGKWLNPSKVQVSHSIFVSNIASSVTKDTLQYYFENNNKSGGGDVEKIVMTNDEVERTCFVFFEDYKVIDDILDKQHYLGDQLLSVKRFQQALGRPEGETEHRVFKVPHSIEIKDANPHKVKFVANSKELNKAFQQELIKTFTRVQWPTDIEQSVQLHCTITKDDKNWYKITKEWGKQSRNEFIKFMDKVDLRRIDILQEIKPKVMLFLKKIRVKEENKVAIVIAKETNQIFVVGTNAEAYDLTKQIEEGVRTILNEAEKEKQTITEIFSTLQPIETKMMIFQQFPNELERTIEDLKVDIVPDKNEIHLKGLVGSVQNAKLAIYDRKNKLEIKSIDNISKLAIMLLQKDKSYTALQSQFEATAIQAIWECSADGLIVCCCKPSSCGKAVEIIRSFFIEDCIIVKRGEVPDLETQTWIEIVDKIYAKHPGMVNILVNDDSTGIQICTSTDIHTSVREEIQSFLRDNTIITQTITNLGQIQRFLEKHCKTEITEIARKLNKFYVEIKHLDYYRGLEIRGLPKGVQDAKKQVQMLLQKIRKERHQVNKPGIADHIISPKGKDSIHTIEHSLECIIYVEEDETNRQVTYKKIHGSKSHTTYQGATIYVWQGDMTELDVDVIVNPSDKNLGFSGGLGKAILAKGGSIIKFECENFIQDNEHLNKGDVFISSAGDLKAENIAHISSQQWDNGKDMDKDLELTVLRCLQEAMKMQKRSLAIPAIGCGINGFPVKISTTSIVNALKRVLMEYQDSSISEIYLCDMNMAHVNGFTEALCTVFGMSNVVLQTEVNITDTCHPTFSADMGDVPKRVSRSKTRISDGDTFSYSTSGVPKRDDFVMGNVAVTLVKGEMAKQKVDMIVNTTSHNLDLQNGAVSNSLAKAAGKEMQNEVNKKFPKGLEDKLIAVTNGHKLNCKFVVHTALPNFKEKDQQESIKHLHKVMKKCLEESQRNNCKSIAFPAFGTGNLGYPRDVVAKEMFKVVDMFQKNSPKSSVKDVRFIVYQMDGQTLTAFQEEKMKLQRDVHSTSFAGQLGKNGGSLGYEVVAANSCSADQQSSGNYKFDSIIVTVKSGDIIQENVDCIVNSTNADLNLNIGKVSKRLLHKGGDAFIEELENHRAEMKKQKIVTTSAPGLPFGHIIHVETGSKDISATVKMCLKEAENEKIKSIAMPAFGTYNVLSVAKNMFKAVREFSKTQPKFLKEVRFIIFQNEMLPDFLKTAEDVCDSTSVLGYMWKGIKSALGMAGSSDGTSDTGANLETDYNSVSFFIVAMSDDIIRKAIKKLEQSLEKEMHAKIIDDHIIRKLEDNQIDEIDGIAIQCRVQMTIDKNKGFIKLAGIVNNVMNASEKINTLLRDAERKEYLKGTAQWFYIEVTGTAELVKPYDTDINMTIEDAYKRQKDTVEYVFDGTDYILDFALMEEYPEGDTADRAKVVRRDLVKGGTFELPTNWEDMQGGNVRVVKLKPECQEFMELKKRFKESAGKYKDANGHQEDYMVDKIERVQNKTIWMQYQSKKKQLEEENPPDVINERELWHGTSADPVDSINAHGFNRSYCGKNATVYGDGVYFAIHAKYSCQNTYSKPDQNGIKRMYLCKVLTGEYAKGERGMRVPPANKKRGQYALYNSVTNDVCNPTMFIIFHDTQACPEYMIYFKEK